MERRGSLRFRTMPALVQPLFDGPLDVVGDVHGHYAALLHLLESLGYDADGRHPDGRRLVFVGDLVDRGEDSPGVFRLVRRLVEAERAQLVLGNHELNLLLGKKRRGNEWFRGLEQWRRNGRLLPQRLADSALRAEMLAFLREVPLALERSDLRVVHACWDARSIDLARRQRKVVAFFHQRRLALRDALLQEPDRLRRSLQHQNGNPVSVLTSGLEAPIHGEPFWAGGKIRHTEREAWWNRYHHRTAVAFGHYWRSPLPYRPLKPVPGPFGAGGGREPYAPLGPRRNAWCLDYSTGYQMEEMQREPWKRQPDSRLAALRWPEGVVHAVGSRSEGPLRL